MTCENCVFSHKPGDLVCNNPNSPNWYRNDGEFCSEGQWLWFGQYLYEHGCEDLELYLCDYGELYREFARDAQK